MKSNLKMQLLMTMIAVLMAIQASAQTTLTNSGIENISGCALIDRPGSYALTKDITAKTTDLKSVIGSNPACILIVANFVTLDLSGHTITGPDTGFGIYVNAPVGVSERKGAYVRNGSVRKFDRGIALEGNGHTAEQVRVAVNGAGLTFDGAGLTARNVHAFENSVTGILCFGSRGGMSVRDSDVHENGTGIDLSACPGSSIIGNTVSGNQFVGINASCSSLVVQNLAFQNGQANIIAEPLDNCTVSDNSPAP